MPFHALRIPALAVILVGLRSQCSVGFGPSARRPAASERRAPEGSGAGSASRGAASVLDPPSLS